jgi:hypothetical protein
LGTGSSDFAIARYKPDGLRDASFGAKGRVVTDFFGRNDSANSIALQSDGKIILAGVAEGATNVFAVARYLVENFALGFDQPAISAARGSAVALDLLINREGGFTGSVTVTPPDASTIGVKVKPAGSVDTTRSRVRVKLKIDSSATVGAHQMTFTGRDDQGRVRTATVTLIIQ